MFGHQCVVVIIMPVQNNSHIFFSWITRSTSERGIATLSAFFPEQVLSCLFKPFFLLDPSGIKYPAVYGSLFISIYLGSRSSLFSIDSMSDSMPFMSKGEVSLVTWLTRFSNPLAILANTLFEGNRIRRVFFYITESIS